MQYIDNDMDDLYHKAGHHYPLKTSGADWNALNSRLRGEDIEPLPPKKNKKNYLWLLLLLLIPLGFAYEYYTDAGENKNISNVSRQQPAGVSAGAISEDQKQLDRSAEAPFPVDQKSKQDSVFDRSVSPDARKRGVGALSAVIHPDEKLLTDSTDKNKNKARSIRYPGIAGRDPGRKAVRVKAFDRAVQSSEKPGKKAMLTEDNPKTPEEIAEKNKPTVPIVNSDKMNRTSGLPVTKPAVVPKTDSDSGAVKSVAPKKRRQTASIPSLYVGLVAAPDLSSVKFQSSGNPGYSVGPLIGYRFGSHWAIEGSALWSRKNYASDGRYFDKSKAGFAPGVTIRQLDGSCEMFEFPLLVRYNFQLNKKHFFVSTGFNSYLMKKENYDYKAYAGGSYYEGFRKYKNSGNDFFSNMQLSVGYEHRLSARSAFRIEPYFKLPVRGVGIGDMPITSTGIYFGLIHSIHTSKN